MKLLLSILASAWIPCFAQVPAQPNKLDITVGPGNEVTVVKRTTNTTRAMTITVNPQDEVTLTHPVVMNSGRKVDLSSALQPSAGTGEFRVKETTEEPVPSTSGAFRTVATLAWLADNDFLVYPGQPGKSHTHAGYCNKNGGDSFQTAETLLGSGDSTCRGGIANRSAYWIGILLDDVTSKPFIADVFTVYYKPGAWRQSLGYGWMGPDGVWHPSATPWPGFSDLPTGLRFVMGSPSKTVPYPDPALKGSDPFAYRWKCGTAFYNSIPQDPVKCPVGATLTQELFAPQCWDGVNLDSPDHKSHLSYPVQVKNVGDPRGWTHSECPASHPKVLPHISFQIEYKVTTDIRRHRLVTDVDPMKLPGIGSHGDVVVAWKPEISKMFVENCIKAEKDCHSHLLGRDPVDGKLKAIY